MLPAQLYQNKTAELETKGIVLPWAGSGNSLTNHLFSGGNYDLAAYEAVKLYSCVAPLGTGINILAEEISSLEPQVYDTKKDEFLPNHPVLDLLDLPNADVTYSEFMFRFSAFFLITGNNYTVATGRVNRPPLELIIPVPQDILIQEGNDGYIGTITVQTTTGATTFKREEIGGRFRFYSGDDLEIYQTRRFNPSSGALVGQSLLSPIFYEIEQYKEASIHNYSLLRRGGRPSGIILMGNGNDGEGLTTEQHERLKEQVHNYMSSSQNAGRLLLANGPKVDYKDLMVTNRDMDFLNLKQNVTNTIYTHLNIPLPFVNPNRQTFNNMGQAKLQLYDNAVLPLADRVFRELDLFLMPRYPNSENLKLTYDATTIPALRLRHAEEVSRKKQLGVYTINEIRTADGAEALDEGGDMIYRPANEIPVADDLYTDDQTTTPRVSRAKFFKLAASSGLSDNELKVIADKYSLK